MYNIRTNCAFYYTIILFFITTSNEALYFKYIKIKKKKTPHNKGDPLNAHIKKP